MNTAMNPKNNQFNVNREPFSKTNFEDWPRWQNRFGSILYNRYPVGQKYNLIISLTKSPKQDIFKNENFLSCRRSH